MPIQLAGGKSPAASVRGFFYLFENGAIGNGHFG
jgi:hypothetical protein